MRVKDENDFLDELHQRQQFQEDYDRQETAFVLIGFLMVALSGASMGALITWLVMR